MVAKEKYFHCIVLCFVIYCLRNILLSAMYFSVYYTNATPYLIPIILGLFYSYILFYAFMRRANFPLIKPYLLILLIISDVTLRQITTGTFSDISTPQYLLVYSLIKIFDKVFITTFAVLAYYHYYMVTNK